MKVESEKIIRNQKSGYTAYQWSLGVDRIISLLVVLDGLLTSFSPCDDTDVLSLKKQVTYGMVVSL